MERAQTEPWGFGGRAEEEKQKPNWHKWSENTLRKLGRNLGERGCSRVLVKKSVSRS